MLSRMLCHALRLSLPLRYYRHYINLYIEHMYVNYKAKGEKCFHVGFDKSVAQRLHFESKLYK